MNLKQYEDTKNLLADLYTNFKDYHISQVENYRATCFGCSAETLYITTKEEWSHLNHLDTCPVKIMSNRIKTHLKNLKEDVK